jgi:hypothetical protein
MFSQNRAMEHKRRIAGNSGGLIIRKQAPALSLSPGGLMKVNFICTSCVSCADAVNLLIPPHQELARSRHQTRLRRRVKNSRLTLIANRTPQPCTFATSAWQQLIKLMRAAISAAAEPSRARLAANACEESCATRVEARSAKNSLVLRPCAICAAPHASSHSRV